MKMRDILDLLEGSEATAFERWFEGSKAVDRRGQPLMVHHGTISPKFDRFEHGHAQPRDGYWYGKGFYFTPDEKTAKMYADRWDLGTNQPRRARVDSYFLRLRNPFICYRGFMPGFMSLRTTMADRFGPDWFTTMPGWRDGMNSNIFVTEVADDFLRAKGFDGVVALVNEQTSWQAAEEIVVFDADDILSVEKAAAMGYRGA